MTDQPKAVPLVEQLRSVPASAKLTVGTKNALGEMDTHSIPVGAMCHAAAQALSDGCDAMVLADGYTGGAMLAGRPAKVVLHYSTWQQADAAFDVITTLIDAALRAKGKT